MEFDATLATSTTTGTVLAAVAGATATIEVEECDETTAFVAPNFTTGAAAELSGNPVPVIVTDVPPPGGPDVGERDVMAAVPAANEGRLAPAKEISVASRANTSEIANNLLRLRTRLVNVPLQRS